MISRSIVRQSSIGAIQRVLGAGVQVLDRGMPSDYASNPSYCPYLLNEKCDGAKDEDYEGKCESKQLNYMHCPSYQWFSEKERTSAPDSPRKDQSLSDTVIMSGDDIVKTPRKKSGKDDSPLDDIIDDGGDLHDFLCYGELYQIDQEVQERARRRKNRQ